MLLMLKRLKLPKRKLTSKPRSIRQLLTKTWKTQERHLVKIKKLLLLALLSVCVVGSTSGCWSTIIAKPVIGSGASFDNNERNSGFLRYDSAGNGIITQRAMERYNDLINIYGSSFVPPITKNYGVKVGLVETNGPTYVLTSEAISKFAKMAGWHRANKPAGTP